MSWLILGCAHLPLLLLHSQALWARPHYQFFPFLFLGAAVLALRPRSPVVASPASPRECALAVSGCWLLFTAAVLLRSPWLGAVSALLTLGAGIFAFGGRSLVGRLAPAWLLLWLAIPPPFGLDQHLIQYLQALTAGWSSPLLDALGVYHLPTGNVIEVPGRELLIDEACSGIQSLFAILACTLFFVLWVERHPIPAVVLLLSAIFWVVLANVLRVVVIASLLVHGQMDWTAGWRHEALGLVTFILALVLTASTDSLLRFLTTGLASDGETEDQPTTGVVKEVPPRQSAVWAPSWPVVLFFALLGLAQCVWFLPAPNRLASTADMVQRGLKLSEVDLPEQWEDFRRGTFRTERRGPDDSNGEHSCIWKYDFGSHQAVVSVDFPFPGWHELPFCYKGIGWQVDSRAVLESDGPEATPVPELTVEANCSQTLGRRGYLLFGLTDTAGQRLAPPEQAVARRLQARLAVFANLHEWSDGPPDRTRTAFQVQLFLDVDSTFSPADRAKARQFFAHVRHLLEKRLDPGSKEGP